MLERAYTIPYSFTKCAALPFDRSRRHEGRDHAGQTMSPPQPKSVNGNRDMAWREQIVEIISEKDPCTKRKHHILRRVIYDGH